jgi:hypothetical protein
VASRAPALRSASTAPTPAFRQPLRDGRRTDPDAHSRPLRSGWLNRGPLMGMPGRIRDSRRAFAVRVVKVRR